MKKILILQSLFLSMFAGYGLAAETNCTDNLARDHSINNQECATAQMSADERVKIELTRMSVTNKVASQGVLCGQCHQDAVQMEKPSGLTSPHGQNMQANSN